MKISFIGHASLLIESQGLRVLTDPWWRGPCFGAQWWNYPPPYLKPVEDRVDYIYISHGHHDHLHPGTLKTLNRDAKVLVSRNIKIADTIRELGFEVIAIGDDEKYRLTENLMCRVIETHNRDTLLALSDGRSVCVNLNDALHATSQSVQDRFIRLLKSLYPEIDYLFCGYGVASHFPNCYRIPGKDSHATAALRQAYFNRRWAYIVAQLTPRFAFPFAADVIFLEDDLMWVNEPTHNTERPTQVFKESFPDSSTIVFDIAPGFEITDGKVTRPNNRQPISLSLIRSEYAENVARANEYGTGTQEVFDDVLRLLRENVALCTSYLREYQGEYRFLIKFRNFPKGISIAKQGKEISVAVETHQASDAHDVTYITRLHYIKWSLSSKYGYEILFVGSGGIFEYASRARAKENIHRELMVILVPHDAPPKSRYGSRSPLSYRLRQAVKRWYGIKQEDLYDLESWTVWEDSREGSINSSPCMSKS